jgi:16S rRNA (cytosine967-C5)-methyltransferase
LTQLDPAIVLALRIGLYQILFLDRVPERAAVDESVRLAEAYGAGRGKGLVNAVLRGALREPGAPSLPGKEADPLGYLTTLSCPGWLAARYLARLGIDRAEALCEASNRTPPVHLRVAARLDREDARELLLRDGIETELLPGVPRGLRVVKGSVAASAVAREGIVFPQDAGSQLVPLLLEPGRGDVVLDVCAAPGGKATALAEMAREGAVIAVDRRRRRVRLLREIASKLRIENIRLVVADGRKLPFERRFDRILLDVPCSSLGTLRRNPDIKWRVQEKDLKPLAELQLELLHSSSRRLSEGGRLVYATCSTEPEENEEVIQRFLGESPGFRLTDVRPSLPEAARHLVGDDGYFRTSPAEDDMDGYFAAVLVRC